MKPTSDPPLSPSRPGEPPWEIASLFPAQGEWTEEDYFALDTRRLVELSEGCLEVLPVPTVFHQLVLKFLLIQLDQHVAARALGHVLPAPLPIRLWSGKIREPDIVFVRASRIVSPHSQPDGADLVVEIVSSGEANRERDLVTKRREYARAGIAEYWIVDPETQRITVLTCVDGTYREHGVFAVGDRATSVLLPEFHVPVAAVFAAGHTEL